MGSLHGKLFHFVTGHSTPLAEAAGLPPEDDGRRVHETLDSEDEDGDGFVNPYKLRPVQEKSFRPKSAAGSSLSSQKLHAKYFLFQLCDIELGFVRHVHKRCSVPLMTWVGGELLKALFFIHQAGLVHRDLKPQNMLFRIDENNILQVMLLDFGLAKPENWFLSRRTGRMEGYRGSSYYGSVEALEGRAQTAIDDVTALFWVLVECVLGELPWWMGKSGRDHEQDNA